MADPVNFQYEDIVKYTKSFSKKVGEGGCAFVYKGKIPRVNRYNLPKQEVVVKKLINLKKTRQFENEITWLEAFQHEGIVRYLGNCRSTEGIFIVLEYIENSDLANNINALSWNDTLMVLRRVAATISYIHAFSPNPPPPGHLVIGDLKCENILLDKRNRPKLCDFGIIDTAGTELYGFTPTVVDPDAYNRNTLNQRDDLYSFGVIILRLIMKEAAISKTGVRIKDLAEEKLRTDNHQLRTDQDYHLVHPKLLESGCSITDAITISKLAIKLTKTKKLSEATSFTKNIFREVLEEAEHEKIQRAKGKKKIVEIEEKADDGDKIRELGASTSGNKAGYGSGSGNESVIGSGKGSVSSEEAEHEKIQGAIEKKKKGEIEEEADGDVIRELGAGTRGNKAGNGNGSGNENVIGSGKGSVRSEEAEHEKIQEAIGKKKKGEIEEVEADDKIHELGASTSGTKDGNGREIGNGSGNRSEGENGSGIVSISSEEPDRQEIQEVIVTLESLTLKQSKSYKVRATEKLQKWYNWLKKSVSKSRN